jgi:hypothetical protein
VATGEKRIHLQRLAGSYAVSRLNPAAAIPAWADGAGFVSISRTADELSIVCEQQRVPAGVTADRDWSALRLVGPFAFDETGIVLSVIRPLSEAGLGVFVVSTFDGDHLLLKTADIGRGIDLLEHVGHRVLAA